MLQLKETLKRQVKAAEAAPLDLWHKVQQRLDQGQLRPAPLGRPLVTRRLLPAFGAVAAILAGVLLGWGLFARGAILSPEALADEFQRQGALPTMPIVAADAQTFAAQISKMVGFEVSPPDLSRCGFRLLGANPTQVAGFRGISFVYRSGSEVVVVSQLRSLPHLQGFSTTAGRGQQIRQATLRDLKLVVWQEGDRMCGLACTQNVFIGPMGRMRCH